VSLLALGSRLVPAFPPAWGSGLSGIRSPITVARPRRTHTGCLGPPSPCRRPSFHPGAVPAHRPRVVDSRVPAKNNEEYHGLERHAWQYHVTAQYAEAFHFFLMAAAMRHEDAHLMGGVDNRHADAVRFCVRHALFSRALSTRPREAWPSLAEFGIDPDQYERRVRRAEEEIDAAFASDFPGE